MASRITFLFSLWIAKTLSFFISILHLGQASNFPGKIGLKFKKDSLKYFRFSKDCKIILISGTNGKSTTCGLLANLLKLAKKRVIYNRSGANLLSGINTTLCHYSSLWGNLNFDYIILETDEATLPIITKLIKPNIVLITNFFRDQLDRFGELDKTVKLIESGINNCNDLILVLNADDPNVAFLNTKPDFKKYYFGININKSNESTNNHSIWISDPLEISYCPYCKKILCFHFKTLGHLGNYYCASCDFKRPKIDFLATEIKTDNLTTNFNIESNGHKTNLFLPLTGIYNLYNSLGAITIAKLTSSITNVQIQKALQSYSTIFGRGEKIKIKDKTVFVFLIKNPTGTTEVLKSLIKVDNSRFLIAINDNYADGRDISWLWDARFDLLSNHKDEIFVSGKRAYDMALRLKYADIPDKLIKVNENISTSIKDSINTLKPSETLFILPTYTVLLELQKKGICKDMPL